MGWLLQMLIESVLEMLSQWIVDMMDIVSKTFLEILGYDLNLFEEIFGVVKSLYNNAIVPMGVALLLLILVWQLFKSMFGRAVNAEEPWDLIIRSILCLFFVLGARHVVNYVLEIAGTPYQWITGTKIKVESFSEYVSALEKVTGSLGFDTLSIGILCLIMQFVVAWNFFKLLSTIAERYALLGVLSYTSPLAFATGGSRATNNILASWSKMFGGQVVLVILNAWSLKMVLSAYGNMIASTYGFTKFFIATLCLVGFCKIALKLDSYMAALGVNLGRQASGLGAMGLMMAAGRLFSIGKGNGGSLTDESGSSGNGVGTSGNGVYEGSGPIPMTGADSDVAASMMDGSSGNTSDVNGGFDDESPDADLTTGSLDANGFDDGNVLDELGASAVDDGNIEIGQNADDDTFGVSEGLQNIGTDDASENFGESGANSIGGPDNEALSNMGMDALGFNTGSSDVGTGGDEGITVPDYPVESDVTDGFDGKLDSDGTTTSIDSPDTALGAESSYSSEMSGAEPSTSSEDQANTDIISELGGSSFDSSAGATNIDNGQTGIHSPGKEIQANDIGVQRPDINESRYTGKFEGIQGIPTATSHRETRSRDTKERVTEVPKSRKDLRNKKAQKSDEKQ